MVPALIGAAHRIPQGGLGEVVLKQSMVLTRPVFELNLRLPAERVAGLRIPRAVPMVAR